MLSRFVTFVGLLCFVQQLGFARIAGAQWTDSPAGYQKFCARLHNIHSGTAAEPALHDFLDRFGLKIRLVADANGRLSREVMFCGDFLVDENDRFSQRPNPKYSEYTVTDFRINRRTILVNDYPNSKVIVGANACSRGGTDCYKLRVTTTPPKTYGSINLHLEAVMPAGVFLNAKLPGDTSFLSSAINRESSVAFQYRVPMSNGKFTDYVVGNLEWSIDGFPCGDSDIDKTEFSPEDQGYHRWPAEGYVATLMCGRSDPRCTRQFVYDVMLSNMRFQVGIALDSGPVTECRSSLLLDPRVNPEGPIDPQGTDFINPIRVKLYPEYYVAINYALPGHIFYPGKVVRQIVEDEGGVSVITYGDGAGSNGDLNVALGPGLFKVTDLALLLEIQRLLATGN